MFDAIMDGLLDSVKLLPFLFLTYLFMEYLESRAGKKVVQTVEKAGKLGPLFGGIAGAFPQCGFSAAATNLYAGRVITVGALIAIYMSTSDEMLPLFISNHVEPVLIIKILILKMVIGMAWGFVIDFFMTAVLHTLPEHMNIALFCAREKCHCEGEVERTNPHILDQGKEHHHHGKGHEHASILRPAIRHTLQIFAFILLFSILLNVLIEWLGEDALKNFMTGNGFLGEFAAGIVGLIPNCASSVVITQLYMDGIIGFGALMSGLLVGAGVGLMVLFRVNSGWKKNLAIMGLLYTASVATGCVISLITG